MASAITTAEVNTAEGPTYPLVLVPEVSGSNTGFCANPGSIFGGDFCDAAWDASIGLGVFSGPRPANAGQEDAAIATGCSLTTPFEGASAGIGILIPSWCMIRACGSLKAFS